MALMRTATAPIVRQRPPAFWDIAVNVKLGLETTAARMQCIADQLLGLQPGFEGDEHRGWLYDVLLDAIRTEARAVEKAEASLSALLRGSTAS